jgi:hypothetical protein
LLNLWDSRAASLTVALGVGRQIGLDREKHKSAGTASQLAGVRTFTLAALLGLNALSYRANLTQYPGLTTEFALLAAFAIGFMAVGQIELAAALGVPVTLLISSKSRLHTFAVSQLSEQELHDATLLAGGHVSTRQALSGRWPLPIAYLRLIDSLCMGIRQMLEDLILQPILDVSGG